MEYEQALEQLKDIKDAVARIDDWEYAGAKPLPQSVFTKRVNEALGKFDLLEDAIRTLREQHDELVENPIIGPVDVEEFCAENPEALDDVEVPAYIYTELWRFKNSDGERLISANEYVTVGSLFRMIAS